MINDMADRSRGRRLNSGDMLLRRVVDVSSIVYVIVWLFEGAIRKWVPGTGAVFYIAHDAVAIIAIGFILLSRPRYRMNWLPKFVLALLAVISLWTACTLVVDSSSVPLVVVVSGLRSYLGPFLLPLVCAMGGANAMNVRRMRFVLLLASPIEFAIIVAQVVSPANAFINLQVGGDTGAFVNAGDVVRASGSFSSPIGLTVYIAIWMVCALWWLSGSSGTGRLLAFGAVSLCLISAFLSGARGSLLQGGVVVVAYLIVEIVGVRPSGRFLAFAVLVGVTIAFVVAATLFPTVVASFSTRIVQANASEDTSARLTDNAWGFIFLTPPVLGSGVGTHSNAGLSLGSSEGWIELDSARWVAELGVLGYVLALSRLVIALVLTGLMVANVAQRGRLMRVGPFLTMSAIVVTLFIGSLNEIPTVEGAFAILLSILGAGVVRRRVPEHAALSMVRRVVVS